MGTEKHAMSIERCARYFALSPSRMRDGNAVSRPQVAKVAKAQRLGSVLGQQGCLDPLLQFLYSAGPGRTFYTLDIHYSLSVDREQL